MEEAYPSNVCKLDGTVFGSREELHAYIRRFKLSQEKYYTECYPRFDKLTKQKIPYKSFEQYFSSDFCNNGNVRMWIQQNPVEGLEWAKNFLKKRKEAKGLVYAPSQTELRSLPCPTMKYFDYAAKEGYYAMCESLGFQNRFKDEPMTFQELPADVQMICDTREKHPIVTKLPTITHKLDVGDYGLTAPHDKGIYIDRKSLPDFIGTMCGKNFERFSREVERAAINGHYLIMMVERPITEALEFNENEQIRQHVKATPEYVFHNVRQLLTQYPRDFQVCFCNGRMDMAKKMVKVFQLGESVKQIDLQWKIEKGEL